MNELEADWIRAAISSAEYQMKCVKNETSGRLAIASKAALVAIQEVRNELDNICPPPSPRKPQAAYKRPH